MRDESGCRGSRMVSIAARFTSFTGARGSRRSQGSFVLGPRRPTAPERTEWRLHSRNQAEWLKDERQEVRADSAPVVDHLEQIFRGSSANVTVISPFWGVNFTAVDRIFQTAGRRRSESPTKGCCTFRSHIVRLSSNQFGTRVDPIVMAVHPRFRPRLRPAVPTRPHVQAV
jgi:hypothetical protein